MRYICFGKCRNFSERLTIWPSGLRRYVQVVFRKGVGSNPTVVNPIFWTFPRRGKRQESSRLQQASNRKYRGRCHPMLIRIFVSGTLR